ncbi:hypothetical protein [Rhodoferax ferrireducens]|uniref:hypothetical protein n=1 Tax=Rhodoferax ferrireducens TaxID=192843 RepID=UPI0018E55552|nr:hypothetical protein [Rhodoferax ferrireducens]
MAVLRFHRLRGVACGSILWSQALAQANIDAKRSDDVFAVYTHFENAGSNNTGLYSLVIGTAVPADTPVPAGMVCVVVPASQRHRHERVHHRPRYAVIYTPGDERRYPNGSC